MSTCRVCIYHVNNEDGGKSHAITGEVLAHMMYECLAHQVTVIGGDAHKVACQRQGTQPNPSYGMSTFRFWLDRVWNRLSIDISMKIFRAPYVT